MVVAIGVGAVALGRLVERHVRTSSAFAVTEITLEGHVRLTREQVLERAGLAVDANVFDVGPEEAEAALLEHPWIAEANVTRRLPGTYSVAIRERRAVALLALGEVFLVSESGAVFKQSGRRSDRPAGDHRHRALAVHPRPRVPHVHRPRGGRAAARLPQRRPRPARAHGELHVERDDGLSLYVGDDATYVRLGHGPFREKLGRLRTVLDELGERGARAAYVYLDNERRPDRVTVRVRDEIEDAISETTASSPSEEPSDS